MWLLCSQFWAVVSILLLPSLLARAVPVVATRIGPPQLPLWSPHLAALLWGDHRLGLFLLKASFLGQPLLNAAFNLSFPWRFFFLSQDRPQSGSNLFQHPPFLLAAKMNHRGSFQFLSIKLLLILFHILKAICVWLKTFQTIHKNKSKVISVPFWISPDTEGPLLLNFCLDSSGNHHSDFQKETRILSFSSYSL